MSIQLVIELPDQEGAQVIANALDAYRARLQANIERTRRRLEAFEQRHGVPTGRFLAEMAAEDLPGGDLEYVEWAGEARLLEGLEGELRRLDHARHQLP
jgi:hypothetical protein